MLEGEMPKGPRIALVEDSEPDEFLFRKMLQSAMPEAEIEAYTNVGDFRAHLEPGYFDCVVLDNRLPDGSGLDLLRELREDETYATLPAIVLTGAGDESVAVKAMKWGASDYLPKSQMTVSTLSEALDGAFVAARREQAKQENNRLLQQQALKDSLTGVFNRRAFDEAVRRYDEEKTFSPLALMYIDLDGFKQVNDVHGHAAGDRVLQVIATRLSDAVRGSDVVYRLGGDEFAVTLSPPPPAENLDKLVKRIVEALYEGVIDAQGREIFSGGGSVGVVTRSEQGETLQAMLEKSDRAMYRAKKLGGGSLFAE